MNQDDKCACGSPLLPGGGCGNMAYMFNTPPAEGIVLNTDWIDPKKYQAHLQELEDTKRQLAEAQDRLSQLERYHHLSPQFPSKKKFKACSDVVFTPKAD
jgi:hypothetical protein